MLCLLLTALAAERPAAAAWNQCAVSGAAGSWQVRKITIPDGSIRLMNLSLKVRAPVYGVVDGSNWHIFGGIWILNARSLNHWSHGFLDVDSALGPPYLRATLEGQGVFERGVPSTDALFGGQGAYFVSPDIYPGTYYVIAFGNGAGTYEGSLNYSGSTLACESVEAPGTLYDFDASDFTGGTQVLTPGHGYVRGAELKFTNERQRMIGGLFAYEPAPFPPAVLSVQTENGSGSAENVITNIGTARTWDLTVDYTGKSNTILLQALGIDLPPCGC